MVTEQHPYKPAQPYKKTTVKNPVDEEMLSIPTQIPETCNAPSIVARLMGMDTIPPGRSMVIDAKESKLPKPNKPNSYYTPRKDPTFDGSPRSAAFRQTKCSLLSYGSTTNTRNGSHINKSNSYNKSSKKEYHGSHKGKKPPLGVPPRQHPQEEALQKFKRDFEAWQSSVTVEKSKGLIVENNIQNGKYIQVLAQKNLNKEKMAKYASTQKKKKKAPEPVQVVFPKNEVHVSDITEKDERSSLPTRIVILKPGFDLKNQIQDPFLGSSNSTKSDCTMVDFLEEVKARLRSEIEGKAPTVAKKQKNGKIDVMATDPKEIARDIAKQIRETVTRDFKKKLTRSKSFKLRNYIPDTSEFVRRDTRRILSEKLENVLRKEADTEKPGTSTEPCRDSFLIQRRERVKSMYEFLSIINVEDNKNDTRCKLDSAGMIDADTESPHSLVRSFSAPLPGTTLGNVLLEDSGLTKWAHMGEEAGLRVERKGRKEHCSGFKGKVSNLRQNLNLKGKLFRKKAQSVETPNSEDFPPLKVIRTIPSALTNPGTNQENYTEVPPSPASISSSSHNEFSGGDNPSPVSPLEVFSRASKKSFGDLSFPISDASPTIQQSKEETEEAEFTEMSKDTEITEILTPERDYVREILVTAGLYENKITNQRNLYISFAPRSLPFEIFEEMEEAFNKEIKTSTEDPSQISAHAEIDRKVLFDLANESMQTLFGPTRKSDTFSEWVGTGGALPSGRILLDEIWKQIDTFSNPPMDEMQTIDSMIGRDVRMDAWTCKLYEDKDVLCKKISVVIYMDLLDDFVQEMGSTMCK